MTDREVVITHLDDLRLFADITVHPVVSPDNWDVYSGLCDYIDQIKTDVEMLLKDQETADTGRCRIFQCKKCGFGIDDIFVTDEKKYQIVPRYCPNCGRSVKLG